MAGKPAGAVSARPGSGDGVAEPCERHPAHWARPCPPPPHRLIFVTNHLPLKVTKDEVSGWSFERDEDALVLQAKGGLPDDMEALYVGCLPVEIEGHEQEVGAAWAACWGCSAGHEEQRAVHRAAARRRGWAAVSPPSGDQMITARCTLTCSLQEVTQQLMTDFNCYPVFLGAELKNNYYKSEAACRCTACSVAAPHVPCLLLGTELRFCRRLPLLAGCVSSLLWACKCGLWPAMRTLLLQAAAAGGGAACDPRHVA